MGDMGRELDSLRLKPLAEVQREWEARLGIKPPKVRSTGTGNVNSEVAMSVSSVRV